MLSRLRLSVAVDKPGRFRESPDLLRRELELSARRASELLFDRVPQILQQVEAVGDLARLRCALSGTLRVESTPVAAHDLYGRTAGEPGRRRNSRSVLQDIQYLAPLKIDHDRPVGAAFASSSRPRPPRGRAPPAPACSRRASTTAGGCPCSGVPRGAPSDVRQAGRGPRGQAHEPGRQHDASGGCKAPRPPAGDRRTSSANTRDRGIAIVPL